MGARWQSGVLPARVRRIAAAPTSRMEWRPPSSAPARMKHLAIDPEGTVLAVGIGGNAVRLTPISGGGLARLIAFPGLSELAWGKALYAGRGAELWKLPLDGSEPERVAAPADRLPGIGVAPDGERLALAHGSESAEVRSFTPSR